MNQQLLEIINDAYEFITRLTIVDKKGRMVTLRPTSEQLEILSSLLKGQNTLVLKPRQIGSSTIVAAYLFWLAYSSTEPMTIAILSHKLKSSKHLFKMFKTFYNNLPEPLQRRLGTVNSTEFRFADTGAGIIAESAGGEGGLRSFTCNVLWLSEYAFAPEPEELLATATSALNDGQLIIESTANYFNDAHHQEIMKAERGLAKWNFIFFPWYMHTEYSKDIPKDYSLSLTNDEEVIASQYELTLEQLYWRRKKIEQIGWEKFSREYPSTVEEAYQQLGDSYFKQRDFQYVEVIKVENTEHVFLNDKKMNDKYAIGVDVSHGVGKDYSVIFILSKMSGQPVAIFRSNKITPVQLAKKIQELATEYNSAKVLIEDNGIGAVVLNELRHLGYTRLWKDEDGKDWKTTTKTKPAMFENLKKKLSNGNLRNIDNITFAELRSLTVNDKGTIIFPDNLDSHCDSAVALALASVCLDSIKLPSSEFLPEFIMKRKAERIKKNNISNHRRY